MASAICAICDIPITPENDSRNHTTGHSWDAALARQLNPFSLFFHISRQDGEPPGQEFPIATGGTIRVTHDGLELPKPTIKFVPNGAITAIQVVARTMEEARRILTG